MGTFRASVLLLALLVVSLIMTGALEAQQLRYMDESGNLHFVDRLDQVPPKYRDQVLKPTPTPSEEQIREMKRRKHHIRPTPKPKPTKKPKPTRKAKPTKTPKGGQQGVTVQQVPPPILEPLPNQAVQPGTPKSVPLAPKELPEGNIGPVKEAPPAAPTPK